MSAYILDFKNIDRTKIAVVGGKGANLGELSRIERVKVPEGFCVTTEAYKEIVGKSEEFNSLLDQLAILKAGDRKKISELSAKVRKVIEEIAIPEFIMNEITRQLEQLDERNSYAVRSSATAEDLPTASFAGQQDTYLNIIGKESILKHISKCWASLFTARAVTYRLQNGFDHSKVHLSVVVQKMVFPQVAGIMFTADPVTANRKVLSIDASFGLGEAMVAGLVTADNYKVNSGSVIEKRISTKKLAIYALKDGGTKQYEIGAEQQNSQALRDDQILQLEQVGRKIEHHFDQPQDIEWCLVDDTFYIVQSRPITTLFPIPARPDSFRETRSGGPEANDNENHVYVSVGHQQMMTDAMKPLGLSFFLTSSRGHMRKAGGRLFVDITSMLASSEGRAALFATLGQSDPLIKDALTTILARENFVKLAAIDKKETSPDTNRKFMTTVDARHQIDNDPSIVSEMIRHSQVSIEELRHKIQTKSGPELFDFILDHIQEQKETDWAPQSLSVIMAGIDASSWINEKMKAWLGEKNVADTLSLSVPNNITSEMGLALLDVADVMRPYQKVIEYLQQVKDDNFLDELVKFPGGEETKEAIVAFLDKFGMRCAGEIDITRTRWTEKPITLVPTILSNIKNLEPNASSRKFEHGRQKALKKEKELLARLKHLPDGEQKAEETKRMISLIRNFIGYREYPKYGIVKRYFLYKQALLKEASRLLQAKVIHEKEDVYYLTIEELREVVRTNKIDYEIIAERKAEHKLFEKLTPPRMITSDGEIISGQYKREDLPAGAIVGLAVSSGVIEGRARVILNMEDADIEDGDILVTSFTDPSWTPLFVSIKGLVTEVGGVMTHGAVVAREYGLPAVVGVGNATKLIKDGQRIRVHGTEGYVEIL